MRSFLNTLIICSVLVFLGRVEAEELMPLHMELRDYAKIELPVGTFINVESVQEISTQYCQDGYKVQFIATNNLYLNDTNVIPENTRFVGYVEDVHDPIIGTNASFKVKITKMILPDDYEYSINGYIYTSNGNMIGGEMTEPASWRKMPHYQSKISGNSPTLQIRPGRVRKNGEHAIIFAGENRIITLTDSLSITHSVTD